MKAISSVSDRNYANVIRIKTKSYKYLTTTVQDSPDDELKQESVICQCIYIFLYYINGYMLFVSFDINMSSEIDFQRVFHLKSVSRTIKLPW